MRECAAVQRRQWDGAWVRESLARARTKPLARSASRFGEIAFRNHGWKARPMEHRSPWRGAGCDRTQQRRNGPQPMVRTFNAANRSVDSATSVIKVRFAESAGIARSLMVRPCAQLCRGPPGREATPRSPERPQSYDPKGFGQRLRDRPGSPLAEHARQPRARQGGLDHRRRPFPRARPQDFVRGESWCRHISTGARHWHVQPLKRAKCWQNIQNPLSESERSLRFSTRR